MPLSSIYTNGIEKYLEETGKENESDEIIKKDFGLFIDDTSLIIYTTKDEKGIRAAQKVVDAIYRYFKDRNLVLNNNKTKVMCIRKKNEELPELHIKDPDGKDIQYVAEVKLLGVIWHENSTMDRLLDATLTKARRAHFMLQRIII